MNCFPECTLNKIGTIQYIQRYILLILSSSENGNNKIPLVANAQGGLASDVAQLGAAVGLGLARITIATTAASLARRHHQNHHRRRQEGEEELEKIHVERVSIEIYCDVLPRYLYLDQ